MPAKSTAQQRYIYAAAERGEQWAKDWLRKYGQAMPKGLPERKKAASAT